MGDRRGSERRMGPPRGLLRHIALQMLGERPMSGSEIMDEVERCADWRPSPGSVYPLLSGLQRDSLIEPHHDQDPGLKRFTLTEKGARRIEELKCFDEQFRRRSRRMRKIFWRLHRRMPEEVYEAFSHLLETVEETHPRITDADSRRRYLERLLDSAEALREIVRDR